MDEKELKKLKVADLKEKLTEAGLDTSETAKLRARAARFGVPFEEPKPKQDKTQNQKKGKKQKKGKDGKQAAPEKKGKKESGKKKAAAAPRPKLSDEEIALLKKRRERFGETVSTTLSAIEAGEKRRAAKAVKIAEQAAADEIKRKRAERFAGAPAAAAAVAAGEESEAKKAKVEA
eukprot:gene1798-12490_t